MHDSTTASLKCYACKTVKPEGEYSPSQRKVGNSKYRYCRPCRVKERKDLGPIPREQRRRWSLKSLYGITPEEFDAIMAEQHGKCAICQKDVTLKSHLDHNHATKRVRGILCAGCNTRLPYVENPTLLEASLRYLKRHSVCGAPPTDPGRRCNALRDLHPMTEWTSRGHAENGRRRRRVKRNG